MRNLEKNTRPLKTQLVRGPGCPNFSSFKLFFGILIEKSGLGNPSYKKLNAPIENQMYLANDTADQDRYRQILGTCFVLCLTFCFPLAAQVNIFTDETTKQMQLEPGWYNSITMDLTYRTGNTDLLTARTRFRSDYLSKTYHGFVFGSLQEGRRSGEFFINKGMAHARIIRRLTQHLFVESFIQKQFNESILLNDRNLAGGGARFGLYSPNSRFKVYLGVGAMWEHERINDKTLGEITTRIVRATNYINWTWRLDERIMTGATGYYQFHVRRFQDYRILFEGSVTFRLTTKLAFPLRVNFRYDSEPPTTIRKHDVEIFNGLRYTF